MQTRAMQRFRTGNAPSGGSVLHIQVLKMGAAYIGALTSIRRVAEQLGKVVPPKIVQKTARRTECLLPDQHPDWLAQASRETDRRDAYT